MWSREDTILVKGATLAITASAPKLKQPQGFPRMSSKRNSLPACLLLWRGQRRNTLLTALGNEALCCCFRLKRWWQKRKAIVVNLDRVGWSPWRWLTLKNCPGSLPSDLVLTRFPLPKSKSRRDLTVVRSHRDMRKSKELSGINSWSTALSASAPLILNSAGLGTHSSTCRHKWTTSRNI